MKSTYKIGCAIAAVQLLVGFSWLASADGVASDEVHESMQRSSVSLENWGADLARRLKDDPNAKCHTFILNAKNGTLAVRLDEHGEVIQAQSLWSEDERSEFKKGIQGQKYITEDLSDALPGKSTYENDPWRGANEQDAVIQKAAKKALGKLKDVKDCGVPTS
jgi:hypothetical protein